MLNKRFCQTSIFSDAQKPSFPMDSQKIDQRNATTLINRNRSSIILGLSVHGLTVCSD